MESPRGAFWCGSLPHAMELGTIWQSHQGNREHCSGRCPHPRHKGKNSHQKLVYCLVFKWEMRQIAKLISLTGKKVGSIQMSTSSQTESSDKYLLLCGTHLSFSQRCCVYMDAHSFYLCQWHTLTNASLTYRRDIWNQEAFPHTWENIWLGQQKLREDSRWMTWAGQQRPELTNFIFVATNLSHYYN